MSRNRLVKAALRRLFAAGQHAGLDVLPRHFYSEVPDLRRLRADDAWKRPYSMIGVRGGEPEGQIAFVEGLARDAAAHLPEALGVWEAAVADNGAEGYGPVEAAALFLFVAARRPAHIFQIGCGVSTAVCLRAAAAAGYAPRVTCVEPYPTAFLERAAAAGRVELVRVGAERLPLARVEALGPDALFFVDSTHTLGPAGEVSRIILEMLPRLPDGAWAHFHDILFPYDYPRGLMKGELFFAHESPLLHAFLVGNERFRLVASLSMLHYACPERLAGALPRYVPAGNDEGLGTTPGDFPSAMYLRVEPPSRPGPDGGQGTA